MTVSHLRDDMKSMVYATSEEVSNFNTELWSE